MLSHTQDNLFMSQTPTRIGIGLLDSAGFNRSYNLNSFNFAYWDLSYLNVTVDGRATTGQPFTIDFAHIQYIRAYFGTNLAIDAGNGVSYNYCKRRYVLYAFDLIASLVNGEQFEMAKSGPLSIELKFPAYHPYRCRL